MSRSKRNHSWAKVMPSPSAPTRCDAGTRTCSNATIGWWWAMVWRVRRCADHADARGRQVDDEHRVLAGVVTADQLGLEERVRRLVEGRHVPLHAVEQVVVAVASGGGRQVVDVGTRELLGDGVALLRSRRARSARATGSPGTASPPQAASRVASPSPRPARWSPGRPAPAPAPVAASSSPRPPSSTAMLVAHRPSSLARSWCAEATPGGSSPPFISASTSNGISSSVKARAVA